jgi:nicotinamide-nucleotide amidase
MTIETLNIGTELLLGDVTNTHAGWMAKQLFPLGLRFSRQTTVPDGPAIRDAVIEAFDRADILLVTGGLGPTTDDITREVVAELLGRKLVASDAVRLRLEALLAARGVCLAERMLRQTMVPEGASVLPNNHGTAPGLYLPAVGQPSSASPHLFLLPGPPNELRPMFRDFVLPTLRLLCGGLPVQECRTYRVVGLGESVVEKMLGLALTANPALEVGYCARPNEVDLRLIGPVEVLASVEPGVLAILGDHLVSARGEGIEEGIVARLAERGETLSTAESCSGGLLASRITDVPGASQVFRQGFVTYSNKAKSDMLGVDSALLARVGAVSEAVARAMAEGALVRSGSTYSLALTGIAGPGGGSPEKPVGLVFIALACAGEETLCHEGRFPVDRATFKQLATQKALDMLRRKLISRT